MDPPPEVSGRIWTQHRAVARILRALPGGVLVSWVVLIPGISHLAGWGYVRFGANRHRVSAWAGYGECGLRPLPDTATLTARPPSGLQRMTRRVSWVISMAVLVFFMSATTYQNLVENRFMRTHFDFVQPAWSKRAVQYGRFFQGWSMFAPDAPKRDGYLVIDAELPDGTRIDPQTGLPPVIEPANFGRMDWDQMWGSYSQRIATKRNTSHRRGLSDWLRNTRIRRLELPAGQRLTRFKVIYIGDYSPAPGSGAAPRIYEQPVIVEWPPPSRHKK